MTAGTRTLARKARGDAIAHAEKILHEALAPLVLERSLAMEPIIKAKEAALKDINRMYETAVAPLEKDRDAAVAQANEIYHRAIRWIAKWEKIVAEPMGPDT
jgi:hypothetical protein